MELEGDSTNIAGSLRFFSVDAVSMDDQANKQWARPGDPKDKEDIEDGGKTGSGGWGKLEGGRLRRRVGWKGMLGGWERRRKVGSEEVVADNVVCERRKLASL